MEYIPILFQEGKCCLNVSETKNDLALLQQEVERLSLLEERCNRKLDEFYLVKLEFEFKLENAVSEKLNLHREAFASEKSNIEKFKDYVETTWQYGANKLGQAQKNLHYYALTGGLPLSVFLQSLNIKMQKRSLEIAHSSSHPYCTSLFYSMYSEITKDHFMRLSTANICLRQYCYLEKAIPFIENLKQLISCYMEKEYVCSLKIFCEEITSGIILSSLGDRTKDDKENLQAFRHVVDLLTGSMLGEDDILDPHTEILPVVMDKPYPEKKMFIRKLVNFYIKDDLIDSDANRMKDLHYDSNVICGSLNVLGNSFTPMTNVLTDSVIQATPQFQIHSPIWNINSTVLPFKTSASKHTRDEEDSKLIKTSGTKKRSRKTACLENEDNSDFNACDLKPIKIPTLEMNLLRPLN